MKYDIGKFSVKSGKIVIGDPYHSHLIDAKINILDVKKGRWNCRIRKTNDETISELIVLHSDMNFSIDDTEYYWEETENTVEIDSEVVGIFDVKSFRNEEVLSESQIKCSMNVNDNTWVDYCLLKSLTHPKASSIPMGVVSSVNAHGDFYNIYVITNSTESIIGIKIQFVEDYEEYIPYESEI